jgi:YD repeat-containing protein
MKGLASCICAHDDFYFLASSIASVVEAGPVICYVSRLAWNGSVGDWEKTAEVAKHAGAEVVLGDWPDESVHRQAALAEMRMRSFKYCLIPDGDEIVEPELLANLQRTAKSGLAERVYVHMDTQQYDADSRPTTFLMGLGTRELCQYDALGRLTTLIQQKSDGTPLLSVVDTYDPGGRKTVSTRDGVPATYSYDKASRLLGQDKAGQVATFSYDNTDNVLVKWHQGSPPLTQTFDPANRIVTSAFAAATTNYTYNGVGNLTLEDTAGVQTGYVYDGENRLIKLTNPDGSVVTHTYQGDGLRRSKQDPGQKPTTFVWDGSDYLQERNI